MTRPKLTFDGAYLVGEVSLDAWGAKPIGIEAPAPDGDVPLSPARAAALDVLAAEQTAIRGAVMDALFAVHAARAGAASRDAFAAQVTPSSITLHSLEREGLAYLGLALRCPWDVEHGLGVMLHGTRVVRAGGADTAVLEWIATRDADAAAGIAAKPIRAPGARKAAPLGTKAKAPTSKPGVRPKAPATHGKKKPKR